MAAVEWSELQDGFILKSAQLLGCPRDSGVLKKKCVTRPFFKTRERSRPLSWKEFNGVLCGGSRFAVFAESVFTAEVSNDRRYKGAESFHSQ